MSRFFHVFICAMTLAALINCAKSQDSSLNDDTSAKRHKLRLAELIASEEAEQRHSLETALAIFDLETEINGRMDFKNKEIETAIRELRVDIVGVTSFIGAVNLLMALSVSKDTRTSTTYRPMFYLALFTGSLYSTGQAISAGAKDIAEKIKLSDAEKNILSENIKYATQVFDFDIVCKYLGLDSEDQRELTNSFRKAVVNFYSKNDQEILTAASFLNKIEQDVNFIKIAKEFKPKKNPQDYSSKLLKLEKFIEMQQIVHKIIDENNKEFSGPWTAAARLELLESYLKCLENEEKAGSGRAQSKNFASTKEKVENQIKILRKIFGLNKELEAKK